MRAPTQSGFLAGFVVHEERDIPHIGPWGLIGRRGLWFAEGGTRDQLIATIFGEAGARRTAEADFAFGCPCSRGRFIDHVAALDKATVADILEKGPWPLETQCHYCSSTYVFEKSDLEAALESRKAAEGQRP